jgi:phage tail tape-measure protein
MKRLGLGDLGAGRRMDASEKIEGLVDWHVLKGETSKRNETKRPKRNGRNETKRPKRNGRNGRKYKLQEKWKILKYEIYGKFY